MSKRIAKIVPVPEEIAVPTRTKVTADWNVLDAMLKPGWALLEQEKFAKVERAARLMIEKEPLFLYAYSQLLDALAGRIAAGKTELRTELRTCAWILLALARRGVDGFHETYWKLYQQKTATMLASLALDAPELVSLADGKCLIAEAARVDVDEDDQMFMTGRWNTAAVTAKY